MAFDESLRSISLNADSSIATYTGVPGLPGSADPNYGKQYRFVKVTGVQTAGLCTANTDHSIGVLQSKPQVVNQAATVAIRGVSFVMAGAAVTAGARVTTDAQGRAITVPGSGTPITYGIALTSTDAAGELVSVLLKS